MSKNKHWDSMFQSLADAMKPHTEMIELSAIWLPNKVYRNSTNGRRIEKDDIVCYHNGELSLFAMGNDNLYKVLKCMGTIGDTKHEILLENLKTKEQITITL